MRQRTSPSTQACRLVGLAMLLLVAGGCGQREQSQEIEFQVPVFVREVETAAVEDTIVATGSVRAAETVVLRADTAGALILGRNAQGRRLAEGDTVASGQIIAEVTGEDVRLAARTDSNFRRYEKARLDYESALQLYDEGLIPQQELRPTETALADARLEWERSQLTESRSKLVTPISGVLLQLARDEQGLPVADGQLISQGFSVAQVAPTRNLIADVDLVGPDLARVRVGQVARVRHHAWDDRLFDGKVIRLAPTLDPMTRTLRAEVRVDNRDQLLRPGMFVEVSMIAERRDNVPVAPREAVAERGGKKVVFVVKGQRVSRRDVVLGLGDDDVVEIRQGLEPGERIVVRGLETLTDGARVRVSGG